LNPSLYPDHTMMNSYSFRYVVNIWQVVPPEKYAVLTVDLRAKEGSKESRNRPKMLEIMLRDFKALSTAEWFTVVVFCHVDQQHTIFNTMERELNLPSDRCFWIDEDPPNPTMDTTQETKGHKSVVEGIVLGYHQATPLAQGVAVKASWQESPEGRTNAYHCPSVKSFMLDENQKKVSMFY
jgi:hypothetical protein